MASISTIEWTEKTWNPLSGCNKVSPGCKNCYAERMAKRLLAMGQYRYRNGFKLTLHHDSLQEPVRWKKPSLIFVNSMSDLFHMDVPDSFIQKTFETMNFCERHRFQILTKRADRLPDIADLLHWTPNIWMGVSVESQEYVYRVDLLRKIPAKIKFLSIEPLLGSINKINLRGIHWVIVGGESGPGARPVDPEWVRELRDICIRSKVPFFFKQWGGVNKKKTGRLLDGREWNEMPTQTQIGE